MIVPRETYVLVKPDAVPKLSDIIDLPEDTQIKPQAVGVVKAVGPRVLEVRPGDRVYFERFDWTAAPGDNILIKEDEILARETKEVE